MSEQVSLDLHDIMKTAIKASASDIHLKSGVPPLLRINGALRPYSKTLRLTPDMVDFMAHQMMNKAQKDKFEQDRVVNLAYGVPGIGRFRVNIFRQRGTTVIVLRIIPYQVMLFADLNLPKIITKLAQEQRGMILVTGTTGQGKSTTLATMIDLINSTRLCHILTIEDPIEFLHRDKKSIVNQREVGFDTLEFSDALEDALRQDPDVILIGEMRNLETIKTAITAAETGHLVLSTLHTKDVTETINRIVTEFPLSYQQSIRLQLSQLIQGIICQRLIPRKDGQGRVPAVEIMVATSHTRDCIREAEKKDELLDTIAKGYSEYGMQTFDQSLMSLFKNNLISYEEAELNSSNPADFKLKLSGIDSTGDASQWAPFSGDKDTSDPDNKGPVSKKEDDLEIERF